MLRLAHRLAALRRFGRAREGATAVEFAIVAIPMLTLVFGIIELGLVLLVSTTLDTATDFAARNIRTGVFQGGLKDGEDSNAKFKKLVCDNMTWLSKSCSGMRVEAETFDQFSEANMAPADAAGTFDPADAPRCWNVGNDGSIVLVRVYYPWKVFTPLMDKVLVNGKAGSGVRVMMSTMVFRNEPYSGNDTEAASCTS